MNDFKDTLAESGQALFGRFDANTVESEEIEESDPLKFIKLLFERTTKFRKSLDAEKKVKEDEKDYKEDKDSEGKVEKGLNADVLKSFGESLSASIVAGMKEGFAELNKSINERFDAMAKNTAPGFKGDMGLSAIEKSIDTEMNEKNGKLEVSVTGQREFCKSLLQNLYEKADENIQKSIEDDYKTYMLDSYANTVGKNLYNYAKSKGFVLCK
jgi:fatty acid/phospholipid biosynthesis enzyme